MADPACGADPSLHESRRKGESFKAWRARLVQARQVCRGCELFAPCLELLDDVRAGRANRNYARAGLEPITVADLPRYAGKPPEAVTERSGRQQTQPERIDAPRFIRRSQA